MHTQRDSEIISGSVDDSALAQIRAAFLRPAGMLTVFQVPGSLLTLICLLCWFKGSRWQKAAFIPLELSWECFHQGKFPVAVLGKFWLLFVTEIVQVEWKKRNTCKWEIFLIRNISTGISTNAEGVFVFKFSAEPLKFSSAVRSYSSPEVSHRTLNCCK